MYIKYKSKSFAPFKVENGRQKDIISKMTTGPKMTMMSHNMAHDDNLLRWVLT
jgi:hypothetical protein